jgi:hypothetical protein
MTVSTGFSTAGRRDGGNEGVLTLRDFLDEKASPIPLDNIDDLARHLIRLTPVLRCAMRALCGVSVTVPYRICRKWKSPPASWIFWRESWCRVRKI